MDTAIAPLQEIEGVGQVWNHEFSSLETFWNATQSESAMAISERSSLNTQRHYVEFSGSKSMEDADDISRHGWAEGLEKISKLAANIGTIVGQYVKKQEYAYDIAGHYVDVGRFTSGDPENMVAFEEQVSNGASGKIVKISCNCATTASTEASQTFRRGAALVALIDSLENAGLVAELEFLAYSKTLDGSDRWHLVRVPVKKSGEHLELDRMAYIFAHASMFRRHVFALKEVQDIRFRRAFRVTEYGGYGRTDDIPVQLRADADLYLPQISYEQKQWQSDEAAIAWVLSTLKAQGVILEGGQHE